MPNFHGHEYKYLRERELNEIYITIAIRTFAISMINLFIPIYLYKLGISLIHIVLYYVFFYTYALFLNYPISLFANKIGFKHSILASMPCMVLLYMLFYSIDKVPWSLPMPAILAIFAFVGSCSALLFWMAFHFDFSKFTRKSKRGTQVGLLKAITTVLSVLGPVVGGVLASISFHATFVIASLLLLVSTIPLFFSNEVHRPIKFKLKYLFLRKNTNKFIAHLGEGIRIAPVEVLWPLFIFISKIGVASVGLIFSAANLVMAAVMFYIGKKSDKRKNRQKFLTFGTISNGIITGTRALFANVYGFYATTILGGLTFAFLIVPFHASMYKRASREPEYLIFRAITLNCGRILTLLIAILAFLYIEMKLAFTILFVIAGLGAILMWFTKE